MTRRAAWMALWAALIWAPSACTAPDVSFGSAPRVEALSRLGVGISTEADVIRALGPPRGGGEALVSRDMTPRKLLFYELVRTRQGAVDLKMLVVLLDDGRYDGHLWFSSADALERKDLF